MKLENCYKIEVLNLVWRVYGGQYLNTDMKNMIIATSRDAQYDASAKRILSQKQIMAWVLIKTVEEFKNMEPQDVIPLIEGEPFVSVIPVERGLSNTKKQKNGDRIVGFNTEDADNHEGMVKYDIVCYVRTKDGLTQVIVNIEAQKDEPGTYDIINRAIFYESRLISSQKERDFKGTEYNNIKKVYSIWICMNMNEDSLSHIHLSEEKIIGGHKWQGNLDIFNIIMIGLAKEKSDRSQIHGLHRLLGILFSENLDIESRLNLLHTEYDIEINTTLREDVNIMCNLSQGIKEDGMAEIFARMSRKGYSPEQIAEMTDTDVREVKVLLQRIK